MAKGLVYIWILIAGLQSVAYAEQNTCVSCHQKLEDEDMRKPVEGMQLDMHSRRGLSCADCHGGDPTAEDIDESMDEDRGYIGVPDRGDIPNFCGKCHQDAAYMRKFNPGLRVDQLDLYWTSVHGQKLRGGDEKVATCIDCHNYHGILPANDARSWVYSVNVPETCGRCHGDSDYMAGYGITTDQYDEYKQSVHGRLLLERGGRGAPACNDCHGNHGAAPPGVSSVSNVCGQCHPVNAGYFAQSRHAAPFEEDGIPACETCHGNHDIDPPTESMLGGDASVCAQCHEVDSNGYLAAAAFKGVIERLRERRGQAAKLLDRAERAGMEVSEAKFQLNEVDNNLIKARTVVHTFSLAQLEAVVAQGDSLAGLTIVAGEQALAELQFRRKGLGVSLIVIVVVGLALVLKIREVDRRRGLQ